jgi:hypothetical protein
MFIFLLPLGVLPKLIESAEKRSRREPAPAEGEHDGSDLRWRNRSLHGLSCPFAGMTRIRFKGFSRHPQQGIGELSAP